MALNAFALFRGRVFFCILSDLIVLSFMTGKAELVRLGLQSKTVLSGMRVMAVRAARLDQRLMYELTGHP